MDKTVRELAEYYGMTKQAMQYHVKKIPKNCKNFGSKNGRKILLVNAEGQVLLDSWLAKKNVEEVAKFCYQREILELRHKLEMKELENKCYLEKIEVLQRRAEEDKQRMDVTLKLLDQAQQLQAMAEQKIKLLEQEEEQTEQEEEEHKKPWWKIW